MNVSDPCEKQGADYLLINLRLLNIGKEFSVKKIAFPYIPLDITLAVITLACQHTVWTLE